MSVTLLALNIISLMSKEEFCKKGWGAGDRIKYEQDGTTIIADVISVNFEDFSIGIDLPSGALVRDGEGEEYRIETEIIYLPCTKCTIVK